jgi:hypothetical protein
MNLIYTNTIAKDLGIIKTYLRSSMAQDRQLNLNILSFEYDIAKKS